MATSGTELFAIMVQRDDGHGDRQRAADLDPVQGILALLDVGGLLRPQRDPLQLCVPGLGAALHAVPGDLVGDDSGPDQLAVPGHDPHGVRDAGAELDLAVLSVLGLLERETRVGHVDDRRRGRGGRHGEPAVLAHESRAEAGVGPHHGRAVAPDRGHHRGGGRGRQSRRDPA